MQLMKKLYETEFQKRFVETLKVDTEPCFNFTVTSSPPAPSSPSLKRKLDAQQKTPEAKKPNLSHSAKLWTINFEGPYGQKNSIYCHPNTKFEKLKLFIKAKSGEALNQPSMFFNGMFIYDMCTPRMLKLKDEVTINVFDEKVERNAMMAYLKTFRINLKFRNVATNEIVVITVNPQRPIVDAYVKYAEVHGLENFTYFHFRYMNGKQIEDMNTIVKNTGFKDGTLIDVVWNSQVLSLSITNKNGGIVMVHLDISSTILDAIKKYAAIVGVPAESIKFKYNNEIVQSSAMLTYLGYQRGSMIHAIY